MRPIAVALICCYVLAATSLRAEETAFPYTTVVTADDVFVRSGPGQNYYPTDKLRHGQSVEVYRHDPGGWCAIRPVEGSFSWVSSRYLKPAEENLAVVTDDGVSARVGSRFSDVRDVIQVRLQKGEVVEVLEPAPRGGGWGENTWCKIAPPSGEFRWVSAKYLDADYPQNGLRKTPHAPRSDRYDRDRTADASVSSDVPTIPDAALEDSQHGDPSRESLRTRSSKPRSLTAEEFEAELERIDMELSMMLIEDPMAWSFDRLRDRSNQLLDQARTAVERGRARLLANKIARFDDIQQRQDAVLAMRDRTDRASKLYAGLRPDADAAEEADPEIDDRFDGVGQLTQVVSRRLGAPRYALTDDSGNVRCYVTPTPGVNLHNYVGRRVGVTGSRGYMPEQRASHIMARHVTQLDGTVVR